MLAPKESLGPMCVGCIITQEGAILCFPSEAPFRLGTFWQCQNAIKGGLELVVGAEWLQRASRGGRRLLQISWADSIALEI